MAEALLRQLLPPLLRPHIEITSAGTHSEAGRPATPQASEVTALRGLDLSGHRSRQLTAEFVQKSDLILGMEAAHVDAARAHAGGAGDRVHLLSELFADPGSPSEGIHDPIGGSLEIYEECLLRIERHLCRIIPHLEERVVSERRR
jgi:protein-tyrosine-phosphatase